MSKAAESSQPIYGNYHGYYSKRPVADDSRLSLIPAELFEDARVLDIGCNEGLITCQIAQTRAVRKVVGVDIDETLIRSAWRRRRTIWSMQQPVRNVGDDSLLEQQPSKKRPRLEEEQSADAESILHPKYFPSSCEHMFGPLPIPPTSSSPTTFPHNVVFHTADWVKSEIPEDAKGYNVIIAFSVSKWIHLSGGDDGLMQFFRRVYSVLLPGGVFVLEPQEWEGYAKARRMNPTLKENGRKLEIRPENFVDLLTNIGFNAPQHLGRAGEGGFRRPIDLYRKPA